MPPTLLKPRIDSTTPAQNYASPNRWMHVLSHIDPAFGGLCAAVPKMAQELTIQQGVDTSVAAFCTTGEQRDQSEALKADVSMWPFSRREWISRPSLRRRFRREIQRSSGVHIHGLWDLSTMAAASAARGAGIPYVLSPHGMLERWALANKGLKKKAYACLFENRNVNGAACIVALTRAEASDCRAFGYRGPIAIIPNGIDCVAPSKPQAFLQRFPEAGGQRLLLFLGRIHYKKGLDILLRAWASLAHQYPQVLLVCVGPDSDGTLARITRLTSELHLTTRVLFTGMLNGPCKWGALAASDYFVLPSYSEGLSVAILEAMSMGLPVIISEQCNLPQIEQAGGGWQVKASVVDLARALSEALSADASTYAGLSANARALAQTEFSWARVTSCTAELYRWINGGVPPINLELMRGQP